MSAQQPVDKNSPLWRAWEAYTRTEDYANAERWAVHPEHAKGSLWDAFVHGFGSATPTPAAQGESTGGEGDE